jgi:ABC-type dipeptide/oligopeptide/nickel transport system permease subunit
MAETSLFASIKTATQQRGLWQDALHRFAKNKLAVAGLIVSTLLIMVTLLAPWIAPYSYEKQNYLAVSQAPSLAHWMGTDTLGRDLLSRVIYGGRISLSIGVLVQLFALLVGLPLGAWAGYYGGTVDNLIMRLVDGMMAFPSTLLAILIMVTLGPGYLNVLLAMVVVGWPSITRLVRGQFLNIRDQEYVLASKAIGASEARVIFQHILPNSLGPIIVAITLGIPATIFREAGLSFIGIGIVPPTPSWGQMVGESYLAIQSAWYQPVFPALTLGLTILALTFVGDGLQDALMPKGRR